MRIEEASWIYFEIHIPGISPLGPGFCAVHALLFLSLVFPAAMKKPTAQEVKRKIDSKVCEDYRLFAGMIALYRTCVRKLGRITPHVQFKMAGKCPSIS